MDQSWVTFWPFQGPPWVKNNQCHWTNRSGGDSYCAKLKDISCYDRKNEGVCTKEGEDYRGKYECYWDTDNKECQQKTSMLDQFVIQKCLPKWSPRRPGECSGLAGWPPRDFRMFLG